MREYHPIRPENRPTEYLYHLGKATRELDDFFSGLYPALTGPDDTLPAEPMSRAESRMNDWGDPDGPCERR